MQALRFAAFTLTLALLAGCGGAQIGAIPQNAATLAQAHQSGKSWMLPEAKNEDLVYTSDDLGNILVLSYPKLKQVGHISVPAYTQGLCVDAVGDVFVPAFTYGKSTQGYVYEFAHGGSNPIQVLTDGAVESAGCAIDPVTGNLAVTDYVGVNIFANAQGNPTSYTVPNTVPQWAAYDPAGDLFVDGGVSVAVLPKGSSTFSDVTFKDSLYGESLQWNDGCLTIVGLHSKLDDEPIYRTQISGTNGTVVGTTTLKVHRWGYDGNGQVLIQGSKILGAGDHHHSLAVWHYPQGGNTIRNPVKNFTPWGVVISVAPSRSRTRH